MTQTLYIPTRRFESGRRGRDKSAHGVEGRENREYPGTSHSSEMS